MIYRLPKDTSKKATLKAHILAQYDPFARRDIFPAGIRYCLNVYTGCAHRCSYCYARNYIIRADEPRGKEDPIKRAKRDIEEMKTLNPQPKPLHISNSSDPFMAELEIRIRATLRLMNLLAENRGHFTMITFLTKNPELASHELYISLFKALTPCQIEVSLTFYNDEIRVFYEPDAPTVQSRLDGIQKLRNAGIPVSLRIDPLFPRETLPEPFWKHPELKSYGIERTHTLEEIEKLVKFGSATGCKKIIVSPLKIPVGYRSPCRLKGYFHDLYADPFGGKPHTKGFAYRLPEDYIHNDLFPSVMEICQHYRIQMIHCKDNLINTK